MLHLCALAFLLLALLTACSGAPRIDYSVNFGWKFLLNATCDECASPTFDTSAWRTLDVPHDFLHELEYDENAAKGGGYLPGAIGWYRRDLAPPPAFDAFTTQLILHFEAVMANSSVYLNGELIATHTSGYTPFRIDVTRFFAASVMPLALLVRADATKVAVYDPKNDNWWCVSKCISTGTMNLDWHSRSARASLS